MQGKRDGKKSIFTGDEKSEERRKRAVSKWMLRQSIFYSLLLYSAFLFLIENIQSAEAFFHFPFRHKVKKCRFRQEDPTCILKGKEGEVLGKRTQ